MSGSNREYGSVFSAILFSLPVCLHDDRREGRPPDRELRHAKSKPIQPEEASKRDRWWRFSSTPWLCAPVLWSSISLISKQSLFEVSENQRHTDPSERVSHNTKHRKQARGTEKPNR